MYVDVQLLFAFVTCCSVLSSVLFPVVCTIPSLLFIYSYPLTPTQSTWNKLQELRRRKVNSEFAREAAQRKLAEMSAHLSTLQVSGWRHLVGMNGWRGRREWGMGQERE
jgi:hypothetical protein